MAWGRLALLDALTDGNHVNEVAATFGYAPLVTPENQSSNNEHAPLISGGQAEQVKHEKAVTQKRQALFWQIQHITDLQPKESVAPDYLQDPEKAQDASLFSGGTYRFELPESVVSMAYLTPLLLNALGYHKTIKKTDDKDLLKRIARGDAVTHLPRQRRLRWSRRLTVIVDKHRCLFPYWLDFDALIEHLQKRLGEDQVVVHTLTDCTETVLTGIPAGSAVLLLTDLRDYDNNARYWQFYALLDGLNKLTNRILTLSPAVASPDDALLCRLGRPHSLVMPDSGSRQVRTDGFVSSDTLEALQKAQEKALTMLSVLPLVDRGLFRKLNKRFRWGSHALDGLIWNHAKVIQDFRGLRLKPEVVARYQEQYQTSVSAADKQILATIVERHHEDAYPGLKHMESVFMAASGGMSEGAIQTYYQSLLACYQQNAQSDNQESVRQQLRTLVKFVPPCVWQGSSKLRTLLHEVFAIAYQDEIRRGEWPDLPAALDINLIKFVQDDTEQPTIVSYCLRQPTLQGNVELEVLEKHSAPSRVRQCEVLRFSSPENHPPTVHTKHLQVQRTVKQTMGLPLKAGDELTITTAQTRWQLSRTHRPDIAANMGQDADGLFMDTRLNDPTSRVYWHPAHSDEQGNIQRGIWYPQRLQSGAGSDVGAVQRDEYGAYRDIDLFGVVQRFRWMEPGRFMMGSHEDEEERSGWEDQHEVTLTQGFWLADTTVTQALWQAVMNKKPSYFKGEQLPVEKVSWRDAKDFIDALNKQDADLQARLPREAEWEYACRAGTPTPFYFGENITPEQVNYDGNYPYNKGEKGEYRSETVEVKSLPSNPWGLYEMHGNVWEWCEDVWQSNLGREAVADPQQVAEPQSDAGRVVRGGSWNYRGWHVRSAFRDRLSPDNRFSLLGFRLALGHIELQAGSRPDNKTDRGERQSPQSGLWSGLREQVSDVLKKMTK